MKDQRESTKRVGILTDYYGNSNYGGVLQAFALQRVISSLDYECEQIQYEFCISKPQKILKSFYYFSGRRFGEKLDLIKRWVQKACKQDQAQRQECARIVVERSKSVQLFSNRIPHSSEIYNARTIDSINGEYDVYVVGSDIVWLPERVLFQKDKVFFLDFVRHGKKIAYAASTGVNILPQKYEKRVKANLVDFNSVSVREKSMVSKIAKICEKDVAFVLDPTMLISKKKWMDSLEIKEEKESKDYVFCYLLGRDKKSRTISKKISEKMGCELKNIKYAGGKYCDADNTCEASALDTIDPKEFVNAILNSSLVITDSFHGIAMSIVMGKEFLAIEREKESRVSFNSRINDVLSAFGLEDRKIRDFDDAIKVLEKPINYQETDDRLRGLREYSLNWLKESLG